MTASDQTGKCTCGKPCNNAVHRVSALLKRWLLGTYQGAVSREHLNYYLDEYTFRFYAQLQNMRSSRRHALRSHSAA